MQTRGKDSRADVKKADEVGLSGHRIAADRGQVPAITPPA